MEMRPATKSAVGLAVALLALLPAFVDAHGRMLSPPGRGSMWRLGFNVPENYNDMSNYCGGIQRQWEQNHGKCGVCGVSSKIISFRLPY
jgi:hypothetical protein